MRLIFVNHAVEELEAKIAELWVDIEEIKNDNDVHKAEKRDYIQTKEKLILKCNEELEKLRGSTLQCFLILK